VVRSLGRARLIGLALAALLGTACTEGGIDDPVLRAALHAAPEVQGVAGPAAETLAGATGLPVDPEAALWVGPADAAPEGEGAWDRLATDAARSLWRERRLPPVEAVAVRPDSLPGAPTGDPVLHAVVIHGLDRRSGVLVGEVFTRLPAQVPPRACLFLGEVALGPVGGAGLRVIPGQGPRPLVRTRVLAEGPAVGELGATAPLELRHCRHGDRLAGPVSVELSAADGVSRADLRAVTGEPDPDAAFAGPPVTRQALHRRPDGSMERRPGPPLPRVERGDAWGLVILPPVDPSSWDVDALMLDGRVAPGPLTGLEAMFTEADGVVVGWDAPASRVGERTAPPGVRPRRVVDRKSVV
jgi:hypothetical protein